MHSKSRRLFVSSLLVAFAAVFTSSLPGPAHAAGGYAAFLQDVTAACSAANLQVNQCWATTVSTFGCSSNPMPLSQYNWGCKNECANKNMPAASCKTFCDTLFK